MKNFFKKKTVFFLFFFTIFLVYGYYISTNKISKVSPEKKNELNQNNLAANNETKFVNVEYKFTNENNKKFITKGKEAVMKKNSDLIFIKTVYSFTKMKDGTLLEVRSRNAVYDKNTKNIKYQNEVYINNKDYKIFCNSAEYFNKKNLIILTNNVKIHNLNNLIKSDIAKLDIKTKNIEILMNNNKDQVYGKKKN